MSFSLTFSCNIIHKDQGSEIRKSVCGIYILVGVCNRVYVRQLRTNYAEFCRLFDIFTVTLGEYTKLFALHENCSKNELRMLE